MKKIIPRSILALALALLSAQMGQAQGTLCVSTLGLTSTGSSPVGSDSWLGAYFTTGTNTVGYSLDSVQLALADASGTPNGFTAMIYTQGAFPAGGFLGTNLGTLNGSLNPVAGGIYTYSPVSTLTLPPRTSYFIVLTGGAAIADGAYQWSSTSTYAPTLSGGWRGGFGFFSSSDGLRWGGNAGGYAQFAIYATAIPEPGFFGLTALGALLVGWRVVRRRR